MIFKELIRYFTVLFLLSCLSFSRGVSHEKINALNSDYYIDNGYFFECPDKIYDRSSILAQSNELLNLPLSLKIIENTLTSAMIFSNESIIYSMLENFEKEYENAKKYNILDKVYFYKYLILSTRFYLEGVSFLEKDIENLILRSKSTVSEDNFFAMRVNFYYHLQDTTQKKSLLDEIVSIKPSELNNSLNLLDLNHLKIGKYIKTRSWGDIISYYKNILSIMDEKKLNSSKSDNYYEFFISYYNLKVNNDQSYTDYFLKDLSILESSFDSFNLINNLSVHVNIDSLYSSIVNSFYEKNNFDSGLLFFENIIQNLQNSQIINECSYKIFKHPWVSTKFSRNYLGDKNYEDKKMISVKHALFNFFVKFKKIDEALIISKELAILNESLNYFSNAVEHKLSNPILKNQIYDIPILLNQFMPSVITLFNKMSNEQYYNAAMTFKHLIHRLDFKKIENRNYIFSLENILEQGIKYAVKDQSYQSEYDLKLLLLELYDKIDRNSEFIFKLFEEVDHLDSLKKITPDYSMYWKYVRLLCDKKNYEKGLDILKKMFQHNFENENFYTAVINLQYVPQYFYGASNLQNELSEFFEKNKNKIQSATNNSEIISYLKVVEYSYYLSRDSFQWIYDNFESIDIDSMISYNEIVFKNTNELTKKQWTEELIGYLLVSLAIKNELAVKNLSKVIKANSYHLKSVYVDYLFCYRLASQPIEYFNKNLSENYFIVSNRILNYENSYYRNKHLFNLSNVLYNSGNYLESIKYLEQAYINAIEIDNVDHEAQILNELLNKYLNFNKPELFKNLFPRYVTIAKSLEQYDNLAWLFEKMSYSFVVDNYSSYEKNKFYDEYFDILKKIKDKKAYTFHFSRLIKHFFSKNDLVELRKLIEESFDLKSNGHIDNIYFYNITASLWMELIKWTDNDYNKNFKLIWNNPSASVETIHKNIFRNLILLKDLDIKLIEPLKTSHPFSYLYILNTHYEIRNLMDNYFESIDDFSHKIEFLMNLPKNILKSGLENAMWETHVRMKNLEKWWAIDSFKGYGFKYKIVHDKVLVDFSFAESNANKVLLNGDEIVIDNNININEEEVSNWIKAKIEKNESISKIIRNDELKLIDLMPGNVQPNLYSKNPNTELNYLMNLHEFISDSLIKIAPNVYNSSFSWYQKDYVLKYPGRYWRMENDVVTDNNKIVSLINRYERTSSFNFLNNAINHKKVLINDPYLIEEYVKKSDLINEIQIKLQSDGISTNKNHELQLMRNQLYGDIDFFENYSNEKSHINNTLFFDFNKEKTSYMKYDIIIRVISSGEQDYSAFVINESKDYKRFYNYTLFDEKAHQRLKLFNKTISYSAQNPKLYNQFLDNLIDITKFMNNGKIPVFKDNIQNIQVLNSLFVPENQFNLFPLELMLFKYESDTTQLHFFSEINNITYTPSLSSHSVFINRQNEGRKLKKALLVSANPNPSNIINYEDNLLSLRSNYGNIEFVDDEIESIKKRMKKTRGKRKIKPYLLNSKQITESAFKRQELSEYKYIHIAAHGVHDKENPRLSGILLGRNENDEDDGILQFHEIFPQNLNADLVTLSSCFSGYGEIDINEGNLGIYRSFLLAGAKSVIISLWNVEDKSTAIFFDKFYENLFEGYGKAESLRMAKMFLKNETEYTHPFFWAPFILIGES